MNIFRIIAILILGFLMPSSADNATNISLRLDELRANPTNTDVLNTSVKEVISNLRYAHLLDENAKKLNQQLLNEILKLPNHASFYRDRIIAANQICIDLDKDVMSHPDGAGYAACDEIIDCFIILRLLPSPQTVQVLGEFLYCHDRERTHEERQKMVDGGIHIGAVASDKSLAEHATTSLNRLGINNGPHAQDNFLSIEQDIWPLWYEQVKAGTRSFSFEGQYVEYRFKKDGTWITTPLINHDRAVTQRRNAQTTSNQPPTGSQNQWYWIAGILLIIVAGMKWLKRTNNALTP